MKPSRILTMVAALAALTAFGVAQQKGGAPASNASKQKQSSQTKKEEPSLFGKKLSYKSSKASKASTTLAFNGVDPSGKVDQAMLSKTPSTEDRAKVAEMAANVPTSDQLRSFLREGGLKRK